MSGGFLRSGSKRCFERLLERRSVPNVEHNACAHTLTKQHHYRACNSPFSLLLRNLKSSPYVYSPSRSYSNASGSGSSKKGFVGWYLGMIESRPVLTKAVTSGFIYTCADLSSQSLTRKSSESFNLTRTLRMAGYGLLIMGPSLHFWFNFVSKVLPKRDVLTTFKKMFVGQTVYGPIMTTTFFSVNAGLQGENTSDILARLKRDLIPTLINGLIYWPMCDFITFKFTPVRLQPLVSNSFAYLWTIYITYMATLKKAGSE